MQNAYSKWNYDSMCVGKLIKLRKLIKNSILPGKLLLGPGLELDINPAGLCKGFNGEFATSPELGLGWGKIGIGDGLILEGREGGEAKLNDVAGLDPKLVCVFAWLMLVSGLAGVCGFEPLGGVNGGWNRSPDSRCWAAGDCGPRWWDKKFELPSISIVTGDGGLSSSDWERRRDTALSSTYFDKNAWKNKRTSNFSYT